MSKPKTFVREATGLVKEISAFRSFLVSLFFIAPALVLLWIPVGQAIFPSANLFISIALALPATLIMAFIYAQFAIAYPRSGGEYIFIGKTFSPSIGFMCNFVTTLILVSSSAVFAVYVSSFGLGPMFATLGSLLGNTALSSLATAFTTPLSEFLIAVITLVILNFIVALGTSTTFKLKTALFIITYIGVFSFIIVFGLMSRNYFISNFDKFSSVSYSQVISLAQESGASLSFSWSDTIGAVVYTILAVLGFVGSSYVAGEVKNPKVSQLVGNVGSLLFYLIIMVIVLIVTYKTIGHAFLGAIGYLALTGNSKYPIPAPLPILTSIAGYGSGNGYLEVIWGVSIIATLFGVIIALTFAATRNIFAWSFDAILPRKIAEVNEKYHSPHYSLLVITIMELLFIYLTIFTPATAYLTYDVTGTFAILAFMGVAGILLPFRRKETFESAPSIVNKKLGRTPLIVIVGVAAIIDGIIIAYETTSPKISGPLNPTYLGMTALFFVVGYIIYWASYGIQKRRGIPVDIIHKEIPPE